MNGTKIRRTKVRAGNRVSPKLTANVERRNGATVLVIRQAPPPKSRVTQKSLGQRSRKRY